MNWIIIVLFLILILIITLITCLVFVTFRRENFTSKDPMLIELQAILSRVDAKASKINIEKADKSYTVNKKNMFLCLKDENGDYFNKNMLVYVALHELAHVLCKSIGHTQEFHNIFDKLLDKAIDMGEYNPSIPIVPDYQDRCQMD